MGMEAVPAAAGTKKPAALPLPPALLLVRARSRASRVADLDDGATAAAAWTSSGPPDTPPRRSPVTVPFLWEEAPGKPKAGSAAELSDTAAATTAAAAAADVTTTPAAAAGDHGAAAGEEEVPPAPAPLKLPPRLQHVASARQQRQRERSVSPKPAALHGPYFYYYSCAGGGGGGAKRPPPPPRRTASGFAAFRRAPSFGAATLFSRSTKSKGGGAAAPVDAPWCSPAASSASSTSSPSSLSVSCFGDDQGHGGHRRPVDGREDGSSEEDECARATVRITRFRRNRSVPSMTTSHLWASIRKSVKQITPWS